MTKSNHEYIFQAIAELKGQVELGGVVAHPDDKMCYDLTDIVGEVALCSYPGSEVKVFRVSELFDVNKVQDRAMELKLEDRMKGN